jgi:hypothetical protein
MFGILMFIILSYLVYYINRNIYVEKIHWIIINNIENILPEKLKYISYDRSTVAKNKYIILAFAIISPLIWIFYIYKLELFTLNWIICLVFIGLPITYLIDTIITVIYKPTMIK